MLFLNDNNSFTVILDKIAGALQPSVVQPAQWYLKREPIFGYPVPFATPISYTYA